MSDLERCTHGRYRIDQCIGCGRKYVDGVMVGSFITDEWHCICGSGDQAEWHSLMCVASNTPDEEWKS